MIPGTKTATDGPFDDSFFSQPVNVAAQIASGSASARIDFFIIFPLVFVDFLSQLLKRNIVLFQTIVNWFYIKVFALNMFLDAKKVDGKAI
jgi:hypothetical protein